MWSYALNAPEYNYLPEAYWLTEEIQRLRDEDYYNNPETFLGADAKVQMTWNPLDGKIYSVVMSTQHDEDVDLDHLRSYVRDNFIKPALGDLWHDDIKLYINYAGSFVLGGIQADSSAVGRKLAITTAMGTVGGYLNNGTLDITKIPMSGGASCVDGETEYMDSFGNWKKIKDYDGGLVGQWLPPENSKGTGKLEFVKPSRYIDEPMGDNDKMYHFTKDVNLDMMLTGDHEVAYFTSKGYLNTKSVEDLIEQHNGSVTGFKGSIPTTFEYDGGKGVNFTDDEIRLQVALCADGSLNKEKPYGARFNIKHGYKKERLRELFEVTGTEYRESDVGKDGYSQFYYQPKKEDKSLYNNFKYVNKDQMKVLAEEVVKWDGSEEFGIYRTTSKQDALFIESVFTSVYGTNTRISEDDRVGQIRKHSVNGKEYETKSVTYEVTIGKNRFMGMKNRKDRPKVEIKEVDVDRKYCFTVPSGYLVLRRNNKVFITHNCGKDSTKVDRSGHLMARYIAKNIVASTGIEECLVQLSYVIGKPEPTSILIQSDELDDEQIQSLVEQVCEQVDLTPSGIIERFDLAQPIWTDVTWDGQFNNPDRPWEKLDLEFKL